MLQNADSFENNFRDWNDFPDSDVDGICITLLGFKLDVCCSSDIGSSNHVVSLKLCSARYLDSERRAL